jgi:hypothetical protein
MNRLSFITYSVILFSMSYNNLENEVVNNSNENLAIKNITFPHLNILFGKQDI